LVGLGCAGLASVAALLAHATMEQRYAVELRWLRWVGQAVPGTIRDTLRLVRLLFRPAAERRAGELRELRLPHEGPRRAAARRAAARRQRRRADPAAGGRRHRADRLPRPRARAVAAVVRRVPGVLALRPTAAMTAPLDSVRGIVVAVLLTLGTATVLLSCV